MKISKKRQLEIDTNKELAKLLYDEVFLSGLSQEELCILNQSKQSIQNVSGVEKEKESF